MFSSPWCDRPGGSDAVLDGDEWCLVGVELVLEVIISLADFVDKSSRCEPLILVDLAPHIDSKTAQKYTKTENELREYSGARAGRQG